MRGCLFNNCYGLNSDCKIEQCFPAVPDLDNDVMVRIVPYRSDWPLLFQEESERINQTFGEVVLAIHHIGSTAIPGIERAKPCIDMILEVSDIEMFDELENDMIALGYVPRGEFGIAGRRFFFRDVDGFDAIRTYHVHAYQCGHSEIERYLNFKDYLIAHPGEAQAYSRLKRELSRKFTGDMTRYTEGKSDFIMDIDRKAKVWKGQQPK